MKINQMVKAEGREVTCSKSLWKLVADRRLEPWYWPGESETFQIFQDSDEDQLG